jgi:3-dehydroquinate dehydratase-2
MSVKKKSNRNILVVHGPNLNLLGEREPNLYGGAKLADIDRSLKDLARARNIALECMQSNHEGVLVDAIQGAKNCQGILINPAAFTHTSVAVRDALLAVKKPVVEVHLSNIFARENFRQKSFVSDIAIGVISGFGANSYLLGMMALMDHLWPEA